MNRVYLSGNEKKVLRHLSLSLKGMPDRMGTRAFAHACQGLQDMGFFCVSWATGHEVVAVDLTDAGLLYIEQNPRLYNPVNWELALALFAFAFAIFSLIITLL